MGGIGSGRHFYFGGKAKTSDYRFVDIRRWQRDGMLVRPSFTWSWFRHGERIASIAAMVTKSVITLQYRIKRNGEWHDVDCKVRLGTTGCNLGGARTWFICPCCGRRVAILYIGKVPACRKCYQLSYPSQCETSNDRQIRRLDNIRERLGWEAGFMNGEGGKPKGMHWKTYHRLYRQQMQLTAQATDYIEQKFSLLNKGLDKVARAMAQRNSK